MYSSYTAASVAREYELAGKHGVRLEGALTWAFEFENQPYFAGFRVLASNGLDLPVLNVFRMFARMSGQRLTVQSSTGLDAETIRNQGVRGHPDVSALASFDKTKLCVLVWHYHDDDLPGPDASVELTLDGLPFTNGRAQLTQYRIDANHGNSFEAWKRMGSPQPPAPAQYAQLEKAGQLAVFGTPETVPINNGRAIIRLKLARQAVALLVLTRDK